MRPLLWHRTCSSHVCVEHRLLFLWTSTCWATLAGQDAVCQLPRVWLENGPPDVVHLHPPGRKPVTAVYRLCTRPAACTTLYDNHTYPVWVEFAFPEPASSGHVHVCSIDGPGEVLSLAAILGPPDQLVLVAWNHPVQTIHRVRRTVSASSRLLLELYCPACRKTALQPLQQSRRCAAARRGHGSGATGRTRNR